MSAFSDLLLSYGPAFYWKLDAVGLANDETANNRDGILNGGITIGGHSATSPGIVGESATCTDFDNVNDFIQSSYNPFTGDITVLGWAYRDTNSGYDTLFSSNATYPNMPVLEFHASVNNVGFTPQEGAEGVEVSTAQWTSAAGAGAWFFWALTFSLGGNTTSLYVNGASLGSRSMGSNWHASPGNFALGDWGTATRPWDGKMAHVAVIEGELTAAQISALYDTAILGYLPIREYRPSLIHAAGRGQ